MTTISKKHPENAPSAPAIPTPDLLARARDLSAQLELVKPLYTELDALTLELVSRASRGEALLLPDGTHARLVDAFLDKDGRPKLTAWKSCGIRRFELDFTDEASAKRAKRDRA